MTKKVIRLNESDLHSMIKEAIDKLNNEETIIKILNNVCDEIEDDKITLYFSDVDSYGLTKKFIKRFNNKETIDLENYDIIYVAKYYKNNNSCILGNLEYGGYGVSFNYLCELTLQEFYTFFKNFTYNPNRGFVRNEVVSYK
jgi:hypothetical protein